MTTYYKPAITASKNIQLPFNGLYNSFLGSLLDDEIESLTQDRTDDKIELINDFISNKVNYQDYHILLTDKYAIHLLEMINREYDCNIIYSNIDYEKMNLQNRGDNLWCDIDVYSLPRLDFIANKLGISFDEVFEQLQGLSNNHFTSYSGFSSFYNPDISVLKDTIKDDNLIPYHLWQDVYVSLIIELMTLNLDCVYDKHSHISDIEQEVIESLNSWGGALEIALSCMTHDDSDKLNNLLKDDSD